MAKRQRTFKSENEGQQLIIASDRNRGLVTLKFDGLVSFMSFSPEHARRLAESLIQSAKEVELRAMQ